MDCPVLPDIVVLIPVFNNVLGLEATLDSLRRVEGDFHVVVVDDGSSVPVSVKGELGSSREVVLLRSDSNQGIASALNLGLREIVLRRGYRYVARVDCGDVVIPKRFRRQCEFLDSNPLCAVVSSFVDFMEPEGRFVYRYTAPCTHDAIMRRMHINNCVVHAGAMIRASALRSAGIYDERVPVAEDYELFLRLGKEFSIAVIPEVLTYCQYNFGGLSVSRRVRQQFERLLLQLQYFDLFSWVSYYGVLRTVFAMVVPHRFVFLYKQMRGVY